MRPKGKLFALLAIFAAIGVVTATGAFTTVTASRTATVNVAGDASALLALEPATVPGGSTLTNNANTYVSTTDDTISIDFSTSAGDGASGINKNAVTTFDKLLNVTNQGSQSVYLSVNLIDNASDDPDDTAETPSNYVTVYAVMPGGTRTQISGSGNAVELSTGTSVYIEIEIDLTGGNTLASDEDLVDNIEFVADQSA